MLCDLLKERGHTIVMPHVRIEDYKGVFELLSAAQPDFVLHCAGITGSPNVDWCESHQVETFQVNAVGTFNLAMACQALKLHLTYFSSGCIYSYDATHPIGTSFSESDPPNFIGSTYSHSKVLSEQLLRPFDNVLILRIRLPISTDSTPKNLINKLAKFAKVTNIPNSVTVLPDMLPLALDMISKKRVGTWNFTNPGPITHSDILTLYRELVQPNHTWEIFSLEEQSKILKAPRSNCLLDSSKLAQEYPLTPALAAIRAVVEQMAPGQ
jgi:3,5-epimerase/4-reductase